MWPKKLVRNMTNMICAFRLQAPKLIDQIFNGGEHDEILFDTLATTYYLKERYFNLARASSMIVR